MRAHTEGRPYDDTEIRLVDRDGVDVAAGHEGEICVRGPSVLRGYVDAQLDAEAFDAAGFFHTGDLGFLDPGGNLNISGRIKDIIIRSGENISAAHIEAHLSDHPSVAEVAVIGLPDPRTGERACAVIVTRPGRDPLDLDQLHAFLLARGLTVQKIPEQLELAGQLPRNHGGKVRKDVLRRQLMAPG